MHSLSYLGQALSWQKSLWWVRVKNTKLRWLPEGVTILVWMEKLKRLPGSPSLGSFHEELRALRHQQVYPVEAGIWYAARRRGHHP